MLDYDQLPDGNVHAAWGDNEYVVVESSDHLNRMIDEVEALSASEEIGQLLHMVISEDVGWGVWMDAPGGLGWAVAYDNAPEYVVSLGNPERATEEMVDIKFGSDWEEQRPDRFISKNEARAATLEFFETRERPDSIRWQNQS